MFDSYEGSTCIIIGNGPSLNKVPVPFLDSYPTFGSNRIYLKYVPTFFVCVNPLVIEQCGGEISRLSCHEKFIREGMGFYDSHELHPINVPMFSYSPLDWVYEGHTVTFVSLQLAFYMGFSTAILVGVDHRYEFSGEPNTPQRMLGDDPNHFDHTYFKGMVWNAPDLERSERAYVLAKEAYERNGRRIVNMTEGSALEVFELGVPLWQP